MHKEGDSDEDDREERLLYLCNDLPMWAVARLSMRTSYLLEYNSWFLLLAGSTN